MGRTDVDRALRRSAEYFFEDGLCEVVVGLWIGLTVALPLLLFGWTTGDTTAMLAFVGGYSVRPAILAAKRRWVHPRTGRVAYELETVPPLLISLGLSPANRLAAGPAPAYWTTSLSYTLPGAFVVSVLFGIDMSKRLGMWGASGHLVIGSLLSGCLLLAWWRWRQGRWIALASVLAFLATAVAFSRLDGERDLSIHAAGIAVAIIASGTLAFVRYLRHAPRPMGETDGR
jgi:hypothetical protein